MSDYTKYFLSIIEIEKNLSQVRKKEKTPIESVSDNLIMYIYGLNINNFPRKINHSKYTTLATGTIKLDEISQNYFKNSFLKM